MDATGSPQSNQARVLLRARMFFAGLFMVAASLCTALEALMLTATSIAQFDPQFETIHAIGGLVVALFFAILSAPFSFSAWALLSFRSRASVRLLWLPWVLYCALVALGLVLHCFRSGL